MISELEKKNLKTGFKEVMNILSQNRAARIIIAKDSEDKIKMPLTERANEYGIMIEFAESRKALGKIVGIDVGASCVAVVKF